MKKNEKIVISILIIICIVMVIIWIVGSKSKNNEEANTSSTETFVANQEEFISTQDDGTKVNTSSKLAETKTVGSFKFENIQLTRQENQTILLADVTNTSSQETESTKVNVTLLDKDGKELTTVKGLISPLKPGAKTQFNTSMMVDYTNAYDIKIEIEK